MTPFNTEQWEQLEPKVKTLWRINGAISSVIFGAMVALPEYFIGRNLGARYLLPEGLIGVLVLIFLVVMSQVFVTKTYDNFRYNLGDDDLAVAKGIFWKQWKFISRTRVQHVDITAGPVNRYLGLVQVSIYVGGMAVPAAVLPGLTEATGEALRKRLVKDDPIPNDTAPDPGTDDPANPQTAPELTGEEERPVWAPPGMDQAPPELETPTETVTEPPTTPPSAQEQEPPRG